MQIVSNERLEQWLAGLPRKQQLFSAYCVAALAAFKRTKEIEKALPVLMKEATTMNPQYFERYHYIIDHYDVLEDRGDRLDELSRDMRAYSIRLDERLEQVKALYAEERQQKSIVRLG